jgi:hypothetical protein
VALGALIAIAASGTAFADDCSGHDHSGATAAGAVGGGLIAGLATHNVAAGLGGALVGGLIGNSVARSQDCSDGDRPGYEGQRAYEPGYGHVYQQGYTAGNPESDYWGVDSYNDFNADYRHIADNIQRGRQDGFYSGSQASDYYGQLQQIRARADSQERNGRFDPASTERRLARLRDSMHSTREFGSNGNG